jgi:hypothetical protein
MTHVWSEELEGELGKFIQMKYPGLPEVWLLLNAKTPNASAIAGNYKHCYLFDEAGIISRLNYPRIKDARFIDQVHFPILDFYLSHRNYDYYWVIEYDVRYTGKWDKLFGSFEKFDHDLITSHIRRFSEEPYWYWWDSLHHPSETIERSLYVRSFNVIYRISNRALKFIHEAQLGGWRGHPEVSLPTLLLHKGYKILDFGGDGEFTLAELKNKTYISDSSKKGMLISPFSTMRWRPSRCRAGMHRNMLYHPVKPKSMLEPLKWRWRYIAVWIWYFIYYNVLRKG